MRRDERGFTAIEFVVITPVLIVALLLVVGMGRMAHSKLQVESMATDAARAASLERNTAIAGAKGTEMAERSMGEAGLSCSPLLVKVNVSSYRPGGVVTADVTCTVQLGDLSLSGLPGIKTFKASAVVPIETYRGS